MKFNNSTNYLLIAIFVAVAGIILMVSSISQNLQGALVISTVSERVLGCVDTDEGENQLKAGYVHVGFKQSHDSCFQKTLKQYKCGKDGRALQVRDVKCEFKCQNGACVPK